MALMGFMSLFYITLPEIQETIEGYLGAEVYRAVRYIIVGKDTLGFTPFYALVFATFIISSILSISFAVDVIHYVRIDNDISWFASEQEYQKNSDSDQNEVKRVDLLHDIRELKGFARRFFVKHKGELVGAILA